LNLIDSVVALDNPAQIDVLTRASLLAHQRLRPATGAGDDSEPG
jgi:hypothetical protein